MPFRGEIDGWEVRHVAETGSTNADLAAAAVKGAPGRTALTADHQTAGRGRLDRTWEAPPGAGLLASVLLRGDDLAAGPNAAVQRLSLAALAACEEVAAVRPDLKWPNDILLDGAKLAGVLAQGGDGWLVIGIGLNVGWAPPGAARLGDGIDPHAVLEATLRAFDALPVDASATYRERLATLGRRVRVELPGGRLILGTAIDVLADGRLVVDADGARHVVDTGDIVHLRED